MLKIEHKKNDTINVARYSDLRYGTGSTLIVDNQYEYLLIEPNNTSVLFNEIKSELPCIKFFKNKNKEIIKSKTSLDKLKFNIKKLTTDYSDLMEKIDWIQWFDWAKTIGGTQPDYGYDIEYDTDGNIIICGYQNSVTHGNYDIFVMKLNNWGEILWQRVIGAANDDRVEAIELDSNNNIYMTGYQASTTPGNADYFILKIDTNGNLVWQKSLGGTSADAARAITIVNDTHVCIVGQQASSTHGHFDASVAKFDIAGNLIWQRTVGDVNQNIGFGITSDTNGNLYVTGHSIGTTGNTNFLLYKLDVDGNMIWQKTIITTDTTGFMEGYGIAYSNNHIFVTGHQNAASYGLRDYFIMKLDLAGNQLWSKFIGGSAEEFSYSVKVDNNGNIYLAGKEHSAAYGGDAKISEFGIIKMLPDGTVAWQRAIGNVKTEAARGITFDNNGSIYVIGYQDSYTFGSYDVGLIKFSDDITSNMNLSLGGVTFNLVNSTLSIGNPVNMVISNTSFACVQSSLNITDWIVSNN